MDNPTDQEAASQGSKPPPSLSSATAHTGQVQEKQSTMSAGLAWIEQNQGIAVVFAFFLILFYMAPTFIITYAAWKTNIFTEGKTSLLPWFAAFMKSSDSTLNLFHKVLLPVMSALSVIVFRGKPNKAMLVLGLFILFSFVLTVVVSVVFDMPKIPELLKVDLSKDEINVFLPLAKAFFTRVQETLMMYLMMLIGIGVANATK